MHGLAKATWLKAELTFEKYNDSSFSQAEKISREAINLYDKSPNRKELNGTYWRLGTALHSQSIFDDAVKNYDTAYVLSEKADDSLYMLYAVFTAAFCVGRKGDYAKSFEKVMQLHQLNTATNNPEWKAYETELLGNLYFALEDYSTALDYYRQSYDLSGFPNYQKLTLLYALNKQFDSARKYFGMAVADTAINKSLDFFASFSGKYYFLTGEYGAGIRDLMKSLEYQNEMHDVNQIMVSQIDLAKAYLFLRQNDSAFKYAQEAMAAGKEIGTSKTLRAAYKILSAVYENLRNPDSAYFYYKQYTVINDSVLNNQLN